MPENAEYRFRSHHPIELFLPAILIFLGVVAESFLPKAIGITCAAMGFSVICVWWVLFGRNRWIYWVVLHSDGIQIGENHYNRLEIESVSWDGRRIVLTVRHERMPVIVTPLKRDRQHIPIALERWAVESGVTVLR